MLSINAEFKKLIPPLTADEFQQLEANCLAEGIRDAIVVWNGYILDGHNRYEIATKHGLEYRTEDKYFESEDDAMLWMLYNQLGRRNLNDYVKGELLEKIEDILKQKGREEQKKGGGDKKTLLSIIDKSDSKKENERHNTRKEISTQLGWSTGKKAMFDVVKKKAPEEVKEKLRAGDMSINQAYKEIKQEEKQSIVAAERKAKEAAGRLITNLDIDFRLGDFETVFSDIPDGSIDCIITDPPYPKEFLECWTKLARFAKRVLKPNGFCIAYSGQMYLPEVMSRMSEHLDYYWTFAVYHTGQTQIVNGVNLICRWKPVLIFQNGKQKISNTIQDYFISESREKTGHDWQQSLSGVSYLIEMFTNEGDLVCEPFAGSGTTIVAAKQMNRKIVASEIDETAYNICKSIIND